VTALTVIKKLYKKHYKVFENKHGDEVASSKRYKRLTTEGMGIGGLRERSLL